VFSDAVDDQVARPRLAGRRPSPDVQRRSVGGGHLDRGAGNRSFSGDSAAGALAVDPPSTNPGGRYSPARFSKSSEAELMQ